MLHIALCDDEPIWLEKMAHYFASRQDLAITTTRYSDGKALVRDCRAQLQHFDAVFLDMEMPGLSGIDTAQALREMDEQMIVIYVTSHTRYMKKAFGYNVLDFVEKAHLDVDLPHALDTVVRELARRRLSFSISDNKKTVHLYYDEVLYIESVGHYLEFHTKETVYRSRSSISQFEATLTPGIFARAHRGYLVNLEHVRAVNAADITLREPGVPPIPLGEKYKQDFQRAWRRYLERKAGI